MSEKNAKKPFKEKISRIIDSLTEDEKKTLCKRFGVNSLDDIDGMEVGQDLFATREKIREIEARVLKKLEKSKHKNDEPPDDVA